jgi:Pentapeptide repeats (8 copies)
MPLLVKTEREPPEAWSVHRARATWKWMVPFLALDWLGKWLAYWLSGWAILEVLEYVETFSLLVVVVFYFLEGPNRIKQKHYQAWQVINTAQGKGGSGGRVEALEELLQDDVSLVGVDVSGAYLLDVKLDKGRLDRSNFHGSDARGGSFQRAKMQFADFSSANIRSGNFGKADLRNANFEDADLNGATLAEADLRDADLSRMDLRNTDLKQVKWKEISDIKLANIFGVRNAPDGFINWALSHGAVAIQSDNDWYEKLNREPAEP